MRDEGWYGVTKYTEVQLGKEHVFRRELSKEEDPVDDSGNEYGSRGDNSSTLVKRCSKKRDDQDKKGQPGGSSKCKDVVESRT